MPEGSSDLHPRRRGIHSLGKAKGGNIFQTRLKAFFLDGAASKRLTFHGLHPLKSLKLQWISVKFIKMSALICCKHLNNPYGSKYLLRKCLGYNLLWFGGLSTFSDSVWIHREFVWHPLFTKAQLTIPPPIILTSIFHRLPKVNRFYTHIPGTIRSGSAFNMSEGIGLVCIPRIANDYIIYRWPMAMIICVCWYGQLSAA